MSRLTFPQRRRFLLPGLGQADTADCGPAPGLGPGEKRVCCPGIGWVVYGGEESEYGICERAAARGSGALPEPAYTVGTGNGEDEDEPKPTITPKSSVLLSPLEASQARWERIQDRRRKVEEKREEMEDERHEQQVRMVQAQIAASVQATREQQVQARIAKLKDELAKELPETAEKIRTTPGAMPLAVGTVGYVGYMLGGVPGALAGAILSFMALSR